MTRPRILVVDDDPDIASALRRGLKLHGFESVIEDRVARIEDRLAEAELQAAIIDVMIGSDSGLDLVRRLRAGGFTRPILMLSALTGVEDRADGLRAGADEYVVKPFALDELVARLRVQLARAEDRAAARFSLDRHSRIARRGRHEVALTERECALLSLFLDRPGQTLSRGELFDRLWTGEGQAAENVVDVYVGYLRRKLAPPAAFGVEIITIRSRGFLLRERGAS
jgi:DNA-binding response OmpR family regulator